MRYAIFSDVHANLEALNAVLDDDRPSEISRYFFVGDIVGYGADPSACLQRLKSLKAVCVAGNHDWAVSGRLSTDYFNEAAREAVFWSQAQLTMDEKIFLDRLPLIHEEENFCLVHGTLNRPQDFNYMTDTVRATNTFYALRQKICFVGHLHQPGIFVEGSEGIVYGRLEKLTLRDDERYIVNVGSVGQPRDGDPRACSCIFDTDKQTVELRRLDYDIATASGKIKAKGLPEVLASRLFVGY